MDSYEEALYLTIGRTVRRMREARGWSQDELARRAADKGLGWGRSSVAALEAGMRFLELTEAILLAVTFDVSVADLVGPTDGEGEDPAAAHLVNLRNGSPPAGVHVAIPVGDVRGVLSGRTVRTMEVEVWTPPPAKVAPNPWKDRYNVALGFAAQWEEDRRRTRERVGIIPRLIADSRQEAERKLARNLGVEPLDVAVAAYQLWKRSLTAEREQRLTGIATEDLPPRRRQAVRGHITRTLGAEIAAAIQGWPKEDN